MERHSHYRALSYILEHANAPLLRFLLKYLNP